MYIHFIISNHARYSEEEQIRRSTPQRHIGALSSILAIPSAHAKRSRGPLCYGVHLIIYGQRACDYNECAFSSPFCTKRAQSSLIQRATLRHLSLLKCVMEEKYRNCSNLLKYFPRFYNRIEVKFINMDHHPLSVLVSAFLSNLDDCLLFFPICGAKVCLDC